MSTISIHRTELLRITHGRSRILRQRFRRTIPLWKLTINSRSSDTSKKEELSVKISIPPQVDQLRPEGLRFDRLQPSEPEFGHEDRLEFGKFVAREAIVDEEYWTAAWLRAESHWEDRSNERYVDNYKRKFAEQEFNAIKRRCKGMQGQKCSCIVAVKKEEKHIKRSVIKSVVGTLDLSIRYFLQGETFPGEKVKSQLFCSINREGSNRYGYIANLCVAKSARRQGIACNILRFAVESARLSGVEQLYVHVHKKNSVAQELYQKTGFKIVETGKFESLDDDTYLLQYTRKRSLFSLPFLDCFCFGEWERRIKTQKSD
ncbi:GNAT domain [Arabidopsis thaliana x Arabidopsis arenosa]|uniref:GNAT domain n=1 Tax=Arabidopsis thaliana x Arabidopsis arenosa TaxID=1240361 RepID=A0A8T2AZZ6_9BRAS|nr:GNAT domain [Arabidopsis thaliana x Arabidopsis arenosa]